MFPATRSRRQALDDFEDGIVLKVEPREICRNRIFVKIDIFSSNYRFLALKVAALCIDSAHLRRVNELIYI